jgi:hypothetical protein
MSAEAISVLGQVAESARFLNDTIAKGTQRLGGVKVPVDFFCECGDPECRRMTRLTVRQYQNRRAAPLIAHSDD